MNFTFHKQPHTTSCDVTISCVLLCDGRKGAWPRSRDQLLNFGTPPLLSLVRMKLQTSNFAAGSRVRNTKQKNKNWVKKGVAYVTWPTFEFWNPLLSPVGMKLQTSKFAAGSRVRNNKQKIKNSSRKGRGLGHVTYFWILEPLLSLVRMKLRTSNLAFGSRLRNTKQKNENWAKRGRGLGHVTYFGILGPPYYLRLGWSYKRQILQPVRG